MDKQMDGWMTWAGLGWAGLIVPESAQNMTNKETGELATVNNLPSRQ